MGMVELRPDREVQLMLRSVELFDEHGVSLGSGQRELSLRRMGPAATLYSDDEGPLLGPLEAGRSVRLRFRARLPDAFASRLDAGPPVTYRATLDTPAGAIIRISGAVGPPWPTA